MRTDLGVTSLTILRNRAALAPHRGENAPSRSKKGELLSELASAETQGEEADPIANVSQCRGRLA